MMCSLSKGFKLLSSGIGCVQAKDIFNFNCGEVTCKLQQQRGSVARCNVSGRLTQGLTSLNCRKYYSTVRYLRIRFSGIKGNAQYILADAVVDEFFWVTWWPWQNWENYMWAINWQRQTNTNYNWVILHYIYIYILPKTKLSIILYEVRSVKPHCAVTYYE